MNDLGSILSFALPLGAVAVMIFFILRRPGKMRTMTCTRCDGSGQVNEHWPDPSKPGGWHDVHGVCPKCGGAGKV
jgi:hypothetical protein